MIRAPAPGGRFPRLRLALVLGAVLLAGCSPAGAVPAPPADPAHQALSWGPCAGFARSDADRRSFTSSALRCAHLVVPLDHDRPGGPTVRIGVLLWPAADPARRVGALVLNPGGPGASGMSAAAALAERLAVDELTARFDLVGFDPRGVGASEPALTCRTAAEREADRADLDVDTSAAGVAATEAEEQELARRCAERNGPDLLARLGSRDVARDLDLLRAALGETRLNYLGYSYGTRIGAEYAALFPDHVRAMVLDGVVDAARPPDEAVVAQAAGFQAAFAAFAAWCATGDCPLGEDPVVGFRRLVDPLIDTPVPAGAARLSYADATTGVLQALYSTALWEPLRQGLAELARGQGETLLSLADLYQDRQLDGSFTTAADVRTAVRCVDDPRVTDPDDLAAVDAQVRAAAPFLDDGRAPSPARGACAFWVVPPVPPTPPGPADGLPPVVVVSTTGDPATPYQAGVELAGTLGARLVTVQGVQHTAYLSGIACLDVPVTAYLVDPDRLPPEALSCPA